MKRSKVMLAVVLALVAVVLAGCGSGGGSSALQGEWINTSLDDAFREMQGIEEETWVFNEDGTIDQKHDGEVVMQFRYEVEGDNIKLYFTEDEAEEPFVVQKVGNEIKNEDLVLLTKK